MPPFRGCGGSIHFYYPLTGFLMGIVFGLLYYFSRSLIPSIIVHILWNLFATTLNSLNN
ncbi:type II CAAX prenyl endopeptidase Rce1 family protein [Paenibacillus sp. NPDC056579]|uniref:CPBP family glutamic-type intramembrane protease n=1 Tax=Paenibacillus sp. NPDC056579 TaxID=3345871 RepID=UPI00369990CD